MRPWEWFNIAPSFFIRRVIIPAGRPPKYNATVAKLICDRIATSTDSLKLICQGDARFPDENTVYRWLTKIEDFRVQYEAAKLAQATLMADQLLDIADDGRNDWMQRLAFNGGNPSWELNGEALGRSRLRVDTRKWLLSKLQPKKYGEHLAVDHSGSLTVGIAETIRMRRVNREPQAALSASNAQIEAPELIEASEAVIDVAPIPRPDSEDE